VGLALGRLLGISFELVRGCFPDQRRQRYGDAEYDWEHRVDTTSATVSWRSRLMGLLNSPYQPIPEDQFREMMRALNIDFSRFTFIDIGSGKGRALMLASEYGFRRIIGVELLPELDRIARQNLTRLRERGKNLPVELVCGDATDFVFPAEPTVVFLFNPLPTSSLARMLQNIKGNLSKTAASFVSGLRQCSVGAHDCRITAFFKARGHERIFFVLQFRVFQIRAAWL